MESFAIENLSFSYPRREKPILSDISLKIDQGEFIALCGASGSGKTTLLRQLKPQMAPHGKLSGRILCLGQDLADLDLRQSSGLIGFVQQNPDQQIVTDKVWHELAFGLENLGLKQEVIRLKVAEMASFFGIGEWFYRDVHSLSGGQKQLLNLAAIMAMSPKILILDEPTSQLDPIAASEFLNIIARLHRELGLTIIMTEHRLEEVLPLAQRMIVLEDGKILADSSPYQVGRALAAQKHALFAAMPTPMRIYAALNSDLACPLTVNEGRIWLNQHLAANPDNQQLKPISAPAYGELMLEMKDIWFKYQKQGTDILKGLNLQLHQGEFLSILGGNGMGKSTALSILAGRNRPYRGKVKLYQQDDGLFLGVLPQNPQTLFVKSTVLSDLEEVFEQSNIDANIQKQRLTEMINLCRLKSLLNQHPYDLSGGEQQRLALAKVLLLRPQVLLLDEPTKGLDAEFKDQLAIILQQLLAVGKSIIMVCHDLEFAAKYAHNCALLFDGKIVAQAPTQEFFGGNNFYTTAANRLARHIWPKAIIAEQIIEALGGQISNSTKPPDLSIPTNKQQDDSDNPANNGINLNADNQDDTSLEQVIARKNQNLFNQISFPRKIMATIALALIIGLAYINIGTMQQLLNIAPGQEINYSPMQILDFSWPFILMIGAFLLFIFALWADNSPRPQYLKNKASTKSLIMAGLLFLSIPLTIYLGISFLENRHYYLIALLIICQTMLPFALVFEGRKPQARELVLIAVLCALAVAGRAAFFMLPQFKPVVAIVIIVGVAFGRETGFLVGAISGFTSNFFFGQGPWTPWQMFSFGLIGFVAGAIFHSGLLKHNKIALAIFGGWASFFLYGLVMNCFATLNFQAGFNWSTYLTTIALALPFDLIHALATAIFIWIIAQPMLEKLERIKIKYGLIK